jgi:hypothetical protein
MRVAETTYCRASSLGYVERWGKVKQSPAHELKEYFDQRALGLKKIRLSPSGVPLQARENEHIYSVDRLSSTRNHTRTIPLVDADNVQQVRIHTGFENPVEYTNETSIRQKQRSEEIGRERTFEILPDHTYRPKGDWTREVIDMQYINLDQRELIKEKEERGRYQSRRC